MKGIKINPKSQHNIAIIGSGADVSGSPSETRCDNVDNGDGGDVEFNAVCGKQPYFPAYSSQKACISEVKGIFRT